MKILLLGIRALLLFNGCALVSCNRVFPKAEWYWSKEAIDCRNQR